MLLRYLPPESALRTAQRNQLDPAELEHAAADAEPEYGAWSQSEMLQAVAIDRLGEAVTALLNLAGQKAKPPEPYPRPGVKSKRRHKPKPVTPEQYEWLFNHINGTPDDDPGEPIDAGPLMSTDQVTRAAARNGTDVADAIRSTSDRAPGNDNS